MVYGVRAFVVRICLRSGRDKTGRGHFDWKLSGFSSVTTYIQKRCFCMVSSVEKGGG